MDRIGKKRLEIILEGCEPFPVPKVWLEQYTIPAREAAELLHTAFLKGDIEGKKVYDLGCGTGRLAIGAALLGAREVVGVDVDPGALEAAERSAKRLSLDNLRWILSDIKDIKGECDTVLQNPPFGVQRGGADRAFLEKALEFGKVIYTMHKTETREFVVGYVEKLGGKVTDLTRVGFRLPHTYAFHRKAAKTVQVDIYRIVKRRR